MTPREQALTDHYLGLLSRTGEAWPWPDIPFTPSHDGNEHVEFNEDGTWSTVVTDRGHEYRRERHTDLHDLMFGLCASATWEAARRTIDEPDLHAHELEDRTQARQVDLMRRIDPDWADRLKRNHAQWRQVRSRLTALDAVSEWFHGRSARAVYLGCALVIAAAVSLIWLTG